ncbi:hypothetical protein V8G54_013551 [Vigna mungo]|uniref:Uncharacterized protein n=1 Tax=Vigna mungo TaxID=3915 RepID=A0AAQ3NV85_VIGMU
MLRRTLSRLSLSVVAPSSRKLPCNNAILHQRHFQRAKSLKVATSSLASSPSSRCAITCNRPRGLNEPPSNVPPLKTIRATSSRLAALVSQPMPLIVVPPRSQIEKGKEKGLTVVEECVEQGKKLATVREDIIKAHKVIINLRVQLKEVTIAHAAKEKDALAGLLEEANNKVFNKHQAGFHKALAQAAFFFNTPLDKGNFEVMKDFYHGKLVNIQDISSNEYVKVESNAEVVT